MPGSPLSAPVTNGFSTVQAATVSDEQPRIHPLSQEGFGAGKSEEYNKVRPSYDSSVLSYIFDAANGNKSSLNVLEVGAGSGKFTRALLAHPAWSHALAALRAVEPNAGMRAVFAADAPPDARVTLAEGTFERTGAPDAWADVVVVATAYHWCLDHDAAMTEFARVLKPHGAVVLLWYEADKDAAPYVRQIWALHEKHATPTTPAGARNPNYWTDAWRAVFSAPAYRAHFAPPAETALSYAVPYTAAALARYVCTISYVAVLPAEERAAVAEEVRAIVGRGEGIRWQEGHEGVFAHPMKCVVVVSRRQ